MSNLFTELQAEQEKQRKLLGEQKPSRSPNGRAKGKKATHREQTPKVTRESTRVRDTSRDSSRENSRERQRVLPTRDEIQEFSFQLRDELKVKVQAEVPHQWRKELDETARELDVRKLELYRFIIGEFLGKVRRKRPA